MLSLFRMPYSALVFSVSVVFTCAQIRCRTMGSRCHLKNMNVRETKYRVGPHKMAYPDPI